MSVALFKGYPLPVNLRRHDRHSRGGQVAFDNESVGDGALALKMAADFDKAFREVDANHLGAMPRQLKGGAPDRTAQIQRSCVWAEPFRVEAFSDGPDRKV